MFIKIFQPLFNWWSQDLLYLVLLSTAKFSPFEGSLGYFRELVSDKSSLETTLEFEAFPFIILLPIYQPIWYKNDFFLPNQTSRIPSLIGSKLSDRVSSQGSFLEEGDEKIHHLFSNIWWDPNNTRRLCILMKTYPFYLPTQVH